MLGPLTLVGQAVTDCEAVHDGLLRQPVNAWSSLAIVTAGVWILLSSLRRTQVGREPPRRNGARLIAVAAIALGGAAYLLGRASSPLCDPGSVVQWHAVWHVLVAISAAAFAVAALFVHDERGERRPRGAART